MEQKTSSQGLFRKARHPSEVKGYWRRSGNDEEAEPSRMSSSGSSSSTSSTLKRLADPTDDSFSHPSSSKRICDSKVSENSENSCSWKSHSTDQDENLKDFDHVKSSTSAAASNFSCSRDSSSIQEMQSPDVAWCSTSTKSSMCQVGNIKTVSATTSQDQCTVQAVKLSEPVNLRGPGSDICAAASLQPLDEGTCRALIEEAMMYESSDSDDGSGDDAVDLTAAATEEAVQDFARRVIHTITQTYVRLRRWQSRHMARSIIDNAINKVRFVDAQQIYLKSTCQCHRRIYSIPDSLSS